MSGYEMSDVFRETLEKRIEMIERDLAVLHQNIPGPGLEGPGTRPPLHVDREALSDDEWEIIHKVEKLRESVFTLCVNMLMTRKR